MENLQEKYKTRTDIIFLKEPVDKWTTITDIKGNSVLENYYKDTQKYGFMFQVMVFQTLLEQLKEALETPNCTTIICERSIASALNIFVKMLYDDENINMMEYKIYTNFYTRYVKETFYPDEIYYLDVPVDVCYQNIVNRQREGEENIDIPYLKKCEKYYKDWLIREPTVRSSEFAMQTSELPSDSIRP